MQVSPGPTRYSGSSRPLGAHLLTRTEPSMTKGKPSQLCRSSNSIAPDGTRIHCAARSKRSRAGAESAASTG